MKITSAVDVVRPAVTGEQFTGTARVSGWGTLARMLVRETLGALWCAGRVKLESLMFCAALCPGDWGAAGTATQWFTQRWHTSKTGLTVYCFDKPWQNDHYILHIHNLN